VSERNYDWLIDNVSCIPAKLIQHSQVGIHVIQVVGIRWVLNSCPMLRESHVIVEHNVFELWLIIDRVKPGHLHTAVWSQTHCGLSSEKILQGSLTHTVRHEQRHTYCFNDNFPGKPGLTSCSNLFFSLFVSNLCIFTAQAKTFRTQCWCSMTPSNCNDN